MSQHKPLPATKADIARLRGVTRGAVTRACKLGGPLHPALVADRIDRAHPACISYLAKADYVPTVLGSETMPTTSEFAELAGVTPSDVRDELAAAVIPAHHVAADRFAELAGVPTPVVLDAVAAELAPAVTSSGRLDITSPAALQFFAAHPLDPDDPPAGFLLPAMIGSEIDITHPVAQVFVSRALGAAR